MRASSPNVHDISGQRLGKYQLMSRLAVGGMAEIYLASAGGKQVVVKLLRPHLATDPALLRMFLDEAHLAAQLQHKNIGQVYEAGEDRGRYYLIMEHLRGHDARALLDHAIAHAQPIPLEHALTVVAGVAAGLHHAHEKRDQSGKPLEIVHRDVSPSNIFITFDGGIKLVDFGLARAATQSNRLRAGMVQGKTAYMSPEQCRSLPLDRRSDVFSLGTVLYELTTSRRLFRTDGSESNYVVMERIVSGAVPLPSTVAARYPAELEEIVIRALAVERDQRYASAQELLHDIEALARTIRLALSPAVLSRYLQASLGDQSSPAGDAEDEVSSPNEFDEEVATTLYAGSLEDLEDAWAQQRKPSPPPVEENARPSMRRLALPLVAEDSDVFETPLLAKLATEPLPGELAARLEASQAAQSEPRPATGPGPMVRAPTAPGSEVRAPTAPGLEVRAPTAPGSDVPTADEHMAQPPRSRWPLALTILLLLAAAVAAVIALNLLPLQ